MSSYNNTSIIVMEMKIFCMIATLLFSCKLLDKSLIIIKDLDSTLMLLILLFPSHKFVSYIWYVGITKDNELQSTKTGWHLLPWHSVSFFMKGLQLVAVIWMCVTNTHTHTYIHLI